MNRNSDNHSFSRPASADDVHGNAYLYDPAVRLSHARFRAANRPSPAGPLPLPDPAGPVLVPRIDPFTEAAVLSGQGAGYARPSATTRLLFGAAGAYAATKVYTALRNRRSR
jgi:hypothetical protein